VVSGIEPVGVLRIGAQELRHHLLEQLAFGQFISGQITVLLEDGVHGMIPLFVCC
jgi:hypothetical protein